MTYYRVGSIAFADPLPPESQRHLTTIAAEFSRLSICYVPVLDCEGSTVPHRLNDNDDYTRAATICFGRLALNPICVEFLVDLQAAFDEEHLDFAPYVGRRGDIYLNMDERDGDNDHGKAEDLVEEHIELLKGRCNV
jgi:hypothetical protein